MSEAKASRLSIRWILPLAMVLPVLVVAALLTLLGFRTARHAADDLAGQNMRQIHLRIESHLNHLMDLPPAINRLNRTQLEEGLLSLDDPARSRAPVYQTLATFPEVSSIVLGSAAGRVMWVIRYPGESTYEYALKDQPAGRMAEYHMDADGHVGDRPLRDYPFDPRVRPWYRAAVDAGGPTWGSVYVWVRGGKAETLGVSYVEPYADAHGVTQGVVNCELTLSDISAFLQRLEVGKTGVAFVMERDGNLVATGAAGVRCMGDGNGRVAAAQAENPLIAGVAKQLTTQFGPLDSIQGTRRGEFTIDGRGTQVVVSSYKNRRNLDWLVVTAAPNADFLAEAVRARRQALWIGTGAVLLTIAFGLTIAFWLLRPILAVVQHARKVGAGDLEARLERHDNREISLLSQALNEMASGLQDRMRMRHALSLAMEVQQSLLPGSGPTVQGIDVAARAQYCDETGGDYYDNLDVEPVGRNSLVMALGDVMGHGVAAAMLMATARGILRSHVRTAGTLGDLLTHVNELLVRDTKGTRFMTMFLGVVDTETRSLRWASAGHDTPLLYDPALRKEIPIEGLGGLPLGVMENQTYDEMTHTGLRDGQIMLVGTDGLWESKNTSAEEFGKERVLAALADLAHLDAAAIEAGLFQRLKTFCGGQSIDDDVTYVVIKFTDLSVSDGNASDTSAQIEV